MSKEPPHENDSLFEVVLTHLQDVISKTDNEDDDDVQEELMSGIRDSIEALFGKVPNSPPNVMVVEGGKKENSPTDSKRPELHFAPDADFSDKSEEQLLDHPDVQVRILKGSDIFSSSLIRTPVPEGKILVSSGENQIISKNTSLQSYRITCTKGILEVVTDNPDNWDPIQIKTGQSIDLEGEQITVTGLIQSEGDFHRISK
jgi:hypothetical protein